ncbi:MAG: cation:proton antiporter [Gemmatimonadetes bacterium]|nr:cation:proton antiporter [Gemmatimonadota bacterium]
MSDLETLFRSELGYVVLLFGLFVVPRVLQRWRLPTAITSFALGAAGSIGYGLFQHDTTLHLLATFGIVALFLFAGLEVDLSALRKNTTVLSQHLLIRIGLLGAVALAVTRGTGMEVRPSALVALALLTPSTGFILDSLDGFGLDRGQAFWVKSKSIATELLALLLLFVLLQSTSWQQLALASVALAGTVAVLPTVFRVFAQRVAPYAPKSEFAFLLMMAIVVAYATRQLGVYYLVGAFVVGIAARRFREALPALASERMLHAVEVFASFFAPFYFFVAGTEMRAEYFSLTAVIAGVAVTAIMVPLRVGATLLHRRAALGETWRLSLRVAVPMTPTLVFTLVIAAMLRDQFAAAPWLFGALILYAILTTVLPGFLLGTPAPTYDAPELPEPAATEQAPAGNL